MSLPWPKLSAREWDVLLRQPEKDRPTHLSGTTEGVLKGWETRRRGGGPVPPEPGTTPVPKGMVRGYHYTRNMDAVEREGLDVGKARGATYGEPDTIWFSTAKPEKGADYVEVFIDPDDIVVGHPLSGGDRSDRSEAALAKIDEFNQGGHDFTTRIAKVPPERFVTTHRRWHDMYRLIESRPKLIEEVLAGKHDHIKGDPDTAEAVRVYKATHGKKDPS